jgi:hypothetical protein|tara:strand:+ start:79 stop:264 length:186 start_codon:yes stop_codon:yes gene_type:complete
VYRKEHLSKEGGKIDVVEIEITDLIWDEQTDGTAVKKQKNVLRSIVNGMQFKNSILIKKLN